MDKPYGCHLCNIGFTKLNELKSHLDGHQNQPIEFRFRCDQCPAAFINKQYLILHQASAHTEQDISHGEQTKSSQEEKAYKCDQCDKSFIRVGNFRTHMHWHENGEDHFECNLCNRKFLNQENLLTHERVHSGNTPYQCGFCSKSYSTIKNLRIHQNRMHKNSKKHACDHCSQTFVSMVKLNQHRMIHFDEPADSDELLVDIKSEQYICNICNKKFQHKGWLENHKKLHEPALLLCNICDRFFKNISDLKQHEVEDHVTHRNIPELSEGKHNEQSYKCDICNKEFIRKPLLDAHLLQHKRQKPFGCNFCPGAFQFANELRMHLMTHKHSRPFSCKLCNARFAQHNQLKTHIRHMHTGLSGNQLTRSPSTEDTSTEENESDAVTVSDADSETDIYVLASSDEQNISTEDEDTDNEAVKHFHPMSKSWQGETDEMNKASVTSKKGPVSFLLFGKLEGFNQRKSLYENTQGLEGTNPKISTQPDCSLNQYDKFEEHFELWENGVSSNIRSFQNPLNTINQPPHSSFNPSGVSEYGRLNQVGGQMIDLPKLSNYAGTDNLLSWPSPQHITLFENIDISEFSDDSHVHDETESKPRKRRHSGRSIMSSGSHVSLRAINQDNSIDITKEENLSYDLIKLDHAKNSNTPNFHYNSIFNKQDITPKVNSTKEEDAKKNVSHCSLLSDISKQATKGKFKDDNIGNNLSSSSRMNFIGHSESKNQNLKICSMNQNENLKGQFTVNGSSLLHENKTDNERKIRQNISENLLEKYFSGKTEICKQFRPKLQSYASVFPKSTYSSAYPGNIQEDDKQSPFKSFIQSYKKRIFQKSGTKKKIRNGHENTKQYDSEDEISFSMPDIVKERSFTQSGYEKTKESDSEVEISFKRPNIKITIRSPKATREYSENVDSSDNEISFRKTKKQKDGVFIKADQNVSFFIAKPMLGYCSSVDECSSVDNDLADQTTIEDCSSIDSDDHKSMSSHGSYLADDSTVPGDDATPESSISESISSSDLESNSTQDYLSGVWDLDYEEENSSVENTLQGASFMYSPISGKSDDESILDDDNLMTDNCSSLESDIEIDIPHQKLHSKRCMKKKKMWLKKNFKFEISKIDNKPFISNAFYQKDSVDETRALQSAVSKIRKKYGENNSVLEDKVASIREMVKRRYFKMKKKSSDGSSRDNSTKKKSPAKTFPTKVSQRLNMNRIRMKNESQLLNKRSREKNYSFNETLSQKQDIKHSIKEPSIRAFQPLVKKKISNRDTPINAVGQISIIRSPRYKTRYAELRIAKKRIKKNSDVDTFEEDTSQSQDFSILSPPDTLDNFVCRQGLLKHSTLNIPEDTQSVKGSSIKSPLYIKSPRYKTRYASQRLAKKRMGSEGGKTSIRSLKSPGAFRITSPIHNTQYASLGPFFNLKSPVYKTRYATRRIAQKRIAIESGKFTDFNSSQLPKGIVYGPTPTSVGSLQTKKRKLSTGNEDLSIITRNIKSKSQSKLKRRSRPRKKDEAACRRKAPKRKGHVQPRKRNQFTTECEMVCRNKSPINKVPKQNIILQSNFEACNKLEKLNVQDVDATIPKTRSGRPVKSPDRYRTIFVSECTVKLSRVPPQKYKKLQHSDVQKDTPFQDIKEKEKKKSKSRKTRNKLIKKTQKDLFSKSENRNNSIYKDNNIKISEHDSNKNKTITRSMERYEIRNKNSDNIDNEQIIETLNLPEGEYFVSDLEETRMNKDRENITKLSRGREIQINNTEHSIKEFEDVTTLRRDNKEKQMENFEIIGIEEAETILANQIREQKDGGQRVDVESICKKIKNKKHLKAVARTNEGNISKQQNLRKTERKIDSLNGNEIPVYNRKNNKISFPNLKNKTFSSKRKRNKLGKKCTNQLTDKKKRLDKNYSLRNKRRDSHDTCSIGSITVYEGVDLDKYIGNESSDSQENFTRKEDCDRNMSDLKLFGRNLDMTGKTKPEERNKYEKLITSSQQETSTRPSLCREFNENTKQLTNRQQNDKICELEQVLPYRIQGYKAAVSEFVIPTVENTRSKCKEREKLIKELQITCDNKRYAREDLKTTVENSTRNIDSNRIGSIKLNLDVGQKEKNMESAFHSKNYENTIDKEADKNEVVKPCIIQKLKEKMGSIVADLMKDNMKKNQAKKTSIHKEPISDNMDKAAYVQLHRLDS
ncbi:KRAB [Mytilus coruscus]|uniref:KRAB n=1 Tax=Mytilus coruscus TaxID=42192 RepID=A0A6J8D2X1_MYTCO|nr:KRAB [Mytilus coruscus]